MLIGLSIIVMTASALYLVKSYKQKDSGCVIILNGPSSAGKSSIIKSFQSMQKTPWLGIGIDNFFVGVIPPKFYLEDKPEHHRVMHGVPEVKNKKQIFTLHVGKDGRKIIHGMHGAIAAYAQAGCNVIVDYIMYDKVWLRDLKQSLKGLKVVTVKVTAPLAIIEQREKARGTSPQGHARSHYNMVHDGWQYDLEVDTSEKLAKDIAQKIQNYLVDTLSRGF